MSNYNWDNLNHLQLGKCAEYFTKIEFMLHGFNIYSSEVDDHGIDLVVYRNENLYYDVQVKSVRNLNYIFFQKDKFIPRKNLLASIVLFFNNEPPQLYLIPSLAWRQSNSLLLSRDYIGKKSKPEWGLNLCAKNLTLMLGFTFDKTVERLELSLSE